jgi:hypothetical protein
MTMIREKVRKISSGYLMLVIILILQLTTSYWVLQAAAAESVPMLLVAIIVNRTKNSVFRLRSMLQI